jgi:predicted O-methyltransferase YrrM
MLSWNRIDAIPGWFSYQSFCVWRALLDEQMGTTGDLVEIGVWKGRSASMLANYRKNDEKIFLCDRRLDELVIHGSIRSTGVEPKNVILVEAFSIDLPAKLDLAAMHHTVRWFHIDGEHTGTAVYRELELANQILKPEGLVVVDDFFSVRYPANTTEVVRYVEKNPFDFRLLAVGFNKAYLCRPESLSRYTRFLLAGMPLSMRRYGWKAAVNAGPTDSIGMYGFIDAAGMDVGPDNYRFALQASDHWSPWHHVQELWQKARRR